MNVFEYLFYLGIINIVFGFAWKWVFMLPAAFIFALLKLDKGVYLAKAFGAYLLVSLTAILTLFVVNSNFTVSSLIFFPLLGLFILYMGFASNSYEAYKEAQMSYNYEMMKMLRYDGFFTIGALVLFIIILFVPTIAINPMTKGLYEIIGWAHSLPVIGWLLGIGGIFFILGTIWHGFIMSGALISSLLGKIKKPQKKEINL